MIEPGQKVEEIPEFAPVLKIVNSPLKADIVFFFHDNPTEDDDPTGIARRIGEERIKLVSQSMAELAQDGLLGAKIEGVMRSNYYHFSPDERINEALSLIFKKVGGRDYWREFKEYLQKVEARKRRGRRLLIIIIAVVALVGLAAAGYFIYGQIRAKSRAQQLEDLTDTTGTRETRYPDGQLKSKIEYLSGERNGPYITWFENGRKMAEGAYKHNLPDGKWVFWDKTGRQIAVVTYVEGRAVTK